MTELLTAAQMRAIEEAAMDSGAVTGLELMERAGCGVVEAIFEAWPDLQMSDFQKPERGASPSRSPEYLDKDEGYEAVVLCGPGNNGGDGFVVARLLHEHGWDVAVVFLGDADKLPPDARVNHGRWTEMGGRLHPWAGRWPDLSAADLLVDGLFGTGLSRGLGQLQDDLRAAQGPEDRPLPRRVAIDIPSGLCADSGRLIDFDAGRSGAFVLGADLTVSFHRAKLGHVLDQGPALCGRMVVKDIGLPAGASRPVSQTRPAEVPAIATQSCVPPGCPDLAKRAGHKFGHGHALVLTGGFGKTGAARLAARGALRVGAGLVTLGVPGAAQMEVAGLISALMLTRVEDADGLAEVLRDDRLNALCLGPGLGLDRARDLVPVALAAGRATVLDADALSAFEDDPGALFDRLHSACVLTPHGGEFKRLFPDIAAKLAEPPLSGPAYSKVDAVREAAARAGCVVLFKGPDTVIAAPDGQAVVNAAVYDRAAPWLATAGSGDVLAGFITGLLARGLPPLRAAEIGAWLHVDCARGFGPGLIAEDLPEEVPRVFRALGL